MKRTNDRARARHNAILGLAGSAFNVEPAATPRDRAPRRWLGVKRASDRPPRGFP